MNRLGAVLALAVAGLLALAAMAQAQTATISGAGATFPFPIYSQWAHKYNQITGVKINYQSIGSGGGIAQIKAKTVSFGASDEPLKAEDLAKAGLIQFPMVVGGVVPVVHIKGVAPGQLRLTAEVLAKIFLGQITKWDDAALKHLNPQLQLPSQAITVVHRADGSGTTWIFTNFLDKKSPDWRQKVGSGKAVAWPAGVGGKGNEGVAAYVQRMDGAIGYVEYAYALQNKMSHTLLQNREGQFVAPSIKSFQAAAANADWKSAPGFYLVLTDQPGAETWPITGASFILMHQQQPQAAPAQAMLKFFDWCYRFGAEMAEKLDYVPIPINVVDLVESTWAKDLTADGKPVWP
jgi:phosphate transport system substrate-binding protein